MNDAAHDRVEEARILLGFLGFDQERSNERSALVLLALAHLTATDPWSGATAPAVGTRAIMDWIRDEYGTEYAPNSRETIRRSTLHQFVAAGLATENPDEPGRPVNSPKWCYKLRDEALALVRANATDQFGEELARYKSILPGLTAKYASERQMARIPVTLPDGAEVTLSPGGQNDLIKLMVDEFCPRYAPGGHVLYVGDADTKWAHFEKAELAALGVIVDEHGKMPDLVVHVPAKNWLILMEAASSHGPVDAGRHQELAALFAGSKAGLVYVSCFPSRTIMRKYLAQIAWETEVWCAEDPTHLIHFDGERFLGPYERGAGE